MSDRNKYIQNYIKENYKRVVLNLRQDEYAKLALASADSDMNVSAYIKNALNESYERCDEQPTVPDNDFGLECELSMMDKCKLESLRIDHFKNCDLNELLSRAVNLYVETVRKNKER